MNKFNDDYDYFDPSTWNNTNGIFNIVNDMLNIIWFEHDLYQIEENKFKTLSEWFDDFLELSGYNENEIEFAILLKDKIIKEFIKKYDKLYSYKMP